MHEHAAVEKRSFLAYHTTKEKPSCIQVCLYNYSKISGAQRAAVQQAAAKPRGGGAGGVTGAEEGIPLVERRNGDARR